MRFHQLERSLVVHGSIALNISLSIALIVMATSAGAENIIGFNQGETQKQRQIETQFDNRISAAEQDAWLKKFSEKPHHVGSAAGKQIAEEVARLMTSWGYDTEIKEYEILLPTPKERLLELTSPTSFFY